MDDADVQRMVALVVGPANREIVLLEARLRAAQLAADVEALDTLIADELLLAGPDGRLATNAARPGGTQHESRAVSVA